MENLKFTDNTAARQYEITVGDEIAKIEYIRVKDKIYLTHTEVPVSLEGKGIGSKLVKKVLEDIEQKDLTLIPLCPFVAGYIKNHPEWRKLVLKGINIK
ncbi:MAG: N-acetyltransferase [Eudoraea sp.]|nr:N-acetyltransferase [Eudoraea sp.]